MPKKRRSAPKGPTVLGLDLGSVTTGWALFSGERLVQYGKMHPGKPGDTHGEKLHAFFVWLVDLLEEHRVDVLIAEHPYPGPRKNVYGVLMMFFGAVHVAWFGHRGVSLPDEHQIGPRDVKHALQLPHLKSYDKRKQQMVTWVNAHYGLELKFKKADRRGTVTESDIADAIAVVHAWRVRNERRSNS